MSDFNGASAVADPIEEMFHFDAIDVTGMHRARVADVPRDVPVSAVAKAVAARMSLPEGAYSLHDSQGALLDNDKPIAEQVEPGVSVTIVPRAHLGMVG
jgi:hypothetical protein